jgi:tRNA-dihydrouridine synthase
MVEAGAKMITVHGRTRTQGFSGHSDNSIIAEVRRQVPREIPVVGNGDVVDVDGYLRMRNETGCDAVMIGRGALGNPWLFRSIKAISEGKKDPGVPTLQERHDIFCKHIELILELKGGPKVLHEVRKASAWYAKGIHGCNSLRQRIWKIAEPEKILEEVKSFFDKAIAKSAQVAA